MIPFGPELIYLIVEVYADPPAHADDHCLAIHRFSAPLEVFDQVISDDLDAIGIADQCLQRGPFGLDLLFPFRFLVLRDFVELFDSR